MKLARTAVFASLALGLSWLGTTPARADTGVVPTCYDAKIPAPKNAATKELFVVIDQTTVLDDGLKQSLANQVRPFVVPGNAFSVVVFSAYTQGKYTQILTSGQLDHPLAASSRDDISKTLLAKLDQCLGRQPGLATQALGSALRNAMDNTTGDIAKSDVMASLKDISGLVRKSGASEKVVLLVSDMLENSSVSSFYAKQLVRRIEPDKEMKLAVDNQLIADFAGARLYVMGAGLLNEEANKSKAAYRDPKTMQALTGFWKSYFAKSNAQLVEFGAPALLNPAQ